MSIRKRIETFINFILGKNELLSLEKSIFIATLVLGIVASFFGALINMFVFTSIIAIIIPLVLATFLAFVYYRIRFKNDSKNSEFLVILIAYVCMLALWITNGGIDGSNSLVFLVAFMLSLFIIPQHQKRLILALFFSFVFVLLFIQLFAEHWIIGFENPKIRLIDHFVTIFFAGISYYLLSKFIKSNYKKALKTIEEKEAKLIGINQELNNMIQSKEKLFTIIAHDLKNPLGSFTNLTALLHEDYKEMSEEDRLTLLKIIKNSADNVYSLLINLLDWTNSQRGAILYNPSKSDLYLNIEKTILLLLPMAKEKRITLINNVPHNLNIEFDQNLISAIFRNLISNAIKFTQNGGTVQVYIENKHKEYYTVCIKDSGIGIAEDRIENIFNLNIEHSTEGTNQEKGTGLGLVLCREFVEMHNGKLWVESELGNGSCFKFTLAKD